MLINDFRLSEFTKKIKILDMPSQNHKKYLKKMIFVKKKIV
jgi:hypothetical protein